MTLNINLDDIVSFNTYGINNFNSFSEVTVVGIISGTSLRFPLVAGTRHGTIYSSLPIIGGLTTPNNFKKYQYIIIKSSDGTLNEIGIPWIDQSSVVQIHRNVATVLIEDFDINRRQELSELLTTNGFTKLTIQVS